MDGFHLLSPLPTYPDNECVQAPSVPGSSAFGVVGIEQLTASSHQDEQDVHSYISVPNSVQPVQQEPGKTTYRLSDLELFATEEPLPPLADGGDVMAWTTTGQDIPEHIQQTLRLCEEITDIGRYRYLTPCVFVGAAKFCCGSVLSV